MKLTSLISEILKEYFGCYKKLDSIVKGKTHIAWKWDGSNHRYNIIEIPADCRTYSSDKVFNEIVACANCGKHVRVTQAYKSGLIRNLTGHSYLICDECLLDEIKEGMW